MAYVTGSAVDLTALRAAIVSACTSNGWTNTSNVLSKGTSFLTLTVNGNFLDLIGATGQSGAALTGAAPGLARLGTVAAGAQALAWPLTYHIFIHANPDEVYVVINYASSYYQWLAWGKSSVSLPGSGMWFSGTFGAQPTFTGDLYLALPDTADGGFGNRGVSNSYCPALFHASVYFAPATYFGEFIHHGIAGGWSSNDVSAAKYRFPIDRILPSAWNSESVLLPFQLYSTAYGSSKVAMVADVAHARACRIDNVDPGAVITLGPDEWMVFPWYLKNSSVPLGGSGVTHSGGMGWAIRRNGSL